MAITTAQARLIGFAPVPPIAVLNASPSGPHCLLKVDTTAEAKAIASRQPPNGFGRGAHLDASSDGMGLLKTEHQDRLTVLLGIPYPVVRLHDHEEWLKARNSYEGD